MALIVSTAGVAAMYGLGVAARRRGFTKSCAYSLAIMLIGLDAWKTWQGHTVYGQPWEELLPLHLCGVSTYLCALVLLLRSYRLFEVAYFWGIGGSFVAMLTPDLSFDFPHAIFVGFFLGHALVLGSILFAIGAYGFKPRMRSIGLTAIVTAIYMLFVAWINLLLDTNYLYLCQKPENATLYDYLGAWPWYIGSAWLIGVTLSFILYLPFLWLRQSRAAHSP